MILTTNGARTLPLVALIAPPALFLVLRLLGSAGPATAPAGVAPQQQEAPLSAAAPQTTNQQRRAMDWLASRPATSDAESPMLHAKHQAEAPPPAPVAETPAPQADDPPFAVKSVMGAGDRVMASINGKVYRVGDEPAPGWKITAMDAKTKRVDLTGPGGKTISVSPPSRTR